MKKYRYTARTIEGRRQKGFVEASSQRSAVLTLKSKNLVITNLSELGRDPISIIFEKLHKVSLSDVVDFTRQLSTMVSAGLPLTEALVALREQSRPAMANVLEAVINDVRGGLSLHEALAKHPGVFSKIYIALVKSGEASGLLDEVLSKLADNLEKQSSFNSRVKSALIYPGIIITAMVVVSFLMMVFVIPKLLSIYQDFGAELPLPTKILIALTNLLTKIWWLIIIFTFGAIYAFIVWKKTSQGRHIVDALMLKIPIIGVLQEKIILTDLTRTLAMLIGTGVSINQSLLIVSEITSNIIFEEAIKSSAKEVEKGVPLASTLARYEFIPPIVTQMITVGEETGKLNEVLERVSRHFEEESDLAVKGLMSAIEPAMIIVLGMGVGFLVVAIIMPIYNLTSQF